MKAKNTIDLSTVFDNRNFNAKELAQAILRDHVEDELLVLALDKNELISNRAMWVLNHCSELDFERVKPFHTKLINHLKHENIHSGVIRSVLRIFQGHPVPKKHETFMLDKCFDYIKNPSEAIAVRVFAMSVAFSIAKPYPELLNELAILLNHLSVTEESAALRSRTKHTLKAIAKINQTNKSI